MWRFQVFWGMRHLPYCICGFGIVYFKVEYDFNGWSTLLFINEVEKKNWLGRHCAQIHRTQKQTLGKHRTKTDLAFLTEQGKQLCKVQRAEVK